MVSVPAKTPPGPRGRLLLGSAPEFQRDPLSFFMRLRREYGPVVRFRMGPSTCYLLSDPEAVHQLLTLPPERVGKPAMVRKGFKKFFGDSLVVLEGQDHRERRRLMQPAFSPKRVDGYAEIMVARTEQMLAAWPTGEERDLEAVMMELSLEIIVESMFGADLAGRSSTLAPALHDVREFAKKEIGAVVSLPDWLPTRVNRRKKAAIALLRSLVRDIVDARRESGEDHGDLLAMLLAANSADDARLTDGQVLDETLSFFLGGHETSGFLLSWAFHLLAKNPRVRERLEDEVDAVLSTGAPALESYRRLDYCQRVVREVLRIRPTAWIFVREPIGDQRAGDYLLRGGSTVFISPFVMHRDEQHFPEPERFDPDRFDDGFAQRVPRYAYLPFGGGSRNCMGQHFSMMLATLALATMVRRVRLHIDDNSEVGLQPMFALGMARPLSVRAEARQPRAERRAG